MKNEKLKINEIALEIINSDDFNNNPDSSEIEILLFEHICSNFETENSELIEFVNNLVEHYVQIHKLINQ